MNNKSGTDLFGARIDGEPTAAEIRLNAEVVAALAVEAGRSRKEHWRHVEAEIRANCAFLVDPKVWSGTRNG